MSDKPPAHSPHGAPDAPVAHPDLQQGLGPEALARRLVLLKTLGKGSAVVAVAAAPMRTLATTPSLKKTNPGNGNAPVCRCDVSGMMSAVGSRHASAPVCSGYRWDKFKDLGNWPGCNAKKTTATFYVGNTQCTQNSTFRSVFGGSSRNSLWKCINSNVANECNWVAALLNSLNAPPSFNFPYSATEVVALYGQDSARGGAALNFFKTYMETKT